MRSGARWLTGCFSDLQACFGFLGLYGLFIELMGDGSAGPGMGRVGFLYGIEGVSDADVSGTFQTACCRALLEPLSWHQDFRWSPFP